MRIGSFSLFSVLALGIPGLAHAHFKLNAPASRSQQDGLGGPQKSAPCGTSDASATADDTTPTNMVTTVQTGSMLTITIAETIFHPGHYRVAIAQNAAGLPADPTVTPGGTACGSVQVDANPALPVLADGLFTHTSSFSGAQTAQIQLPPGMKCDNCVLQIEQFMSNHGLNNPGGCFYHHCATITISDTAPPQVDGPASSGDDNGDMTGGDDAGGCCDARSDGKTAGLGALLVGLALMRRRRR